MHVSTHVCVHKSTDIDMDIDIYIHAEIYIFRYFKAKVNLDDKSVSSLF